MKQMAIAASDVLLKRFLGLDHTDLICGADWIPGTRTVRFYFYKQDGPEELDMFEQESAELIHASTDD